MPLGNRYGRRYERRRSDPASLTFSARTAFQALPLGRRLAEFEIRGVIGEGGFSIVYKAWDDSLHRQIALGEYIPYGLAVRDPTAGVKVRSAKH